MNTSTDYITVNVMSDAKDGNGGEQGLEFLSSSRFVDEDGEVADGFFTAVGSDLIPIPRSSQLEPCKQQFTYADERSTDIKKLGGSRGAVTIISPRCSGKYDLHAIYISFIIFFVTFK